MARPIHKLSDSFCKAIKVKGVHSDGGGLYLRIQAAGSKSWIFIFRYNSKRREIGLGSYPATTLANARRQATEYVTMVADGKDPRKERNPITEPSFEECAAMFLEAHQETWRNTKHKQQWHMTLRDYAKPISKKRVSEIDINDILKILKPIWLEKAETASRTRGRVERVLDFAKVRGWREGENPAAWRGNLALVLPKPSKLKRGHHPSMPYDELPDFMMKLFAQHSVAARTLAFLILTAARNGEVRNTIWSEFDIGNKIWTIPKTRMKAIKEHRVPLGPRAVDIVQSMSAASMGAYVFPGQRNGKPISDTSLIKLMKELGADKYTLHGFRSTFRDYIGDKTNFPRELAETALAHAVGDATERAYRRSDALERRRVMMAVWEDYCSSRL